MDTITNRPDIELINNVKTDKCSSSLTALIERHSPLCYDIYHQYAHKISASGLSVKDVSDDKDYIFYKSVLSFDPDRNVKFTTWLGNQIKYQCLTAISNDGRYVCMEDHEIQHHIDENTKNEPSVSPNENTLDYVLNILSQLKDPRIKQIFEMRYLDCSEARPPWKKIAKKLGISHQAAINLHTKGKRILAQKLNSDAFFDKI